MATSVFERVATEPGLTIDRMLQDGLAQAAGATTLVLFWRVESTGKLFPTFVVSSQSEQGIEEYLDLGPVAERFASGVTARPSNGDPKPPLCPAAASAIADSGGASLGLLAAYGEPGERLAAELDRVAARLVAVRRQISMFCKVQLRRTVFELGALGVRRTAEGQSVEELLERAGMMAEIAVGSCAMAVLTAEAPSRRLVLRSVYRRANGRITVDTASLDGGWVRPPDEAELIASLQKKSGAESVRALPLATVGKDGRLLFGWGGAMPRHPDIDGGLRAIARHLGPGLVIARMRNAMRVHRDVLAGSQRRLGFSSRAGRELSSTLDEASIHATVGKLAVPELCDYCFLHAVDKETRSYRLVAFAGIDATTSANLKTHFLQRVPATLSEDGLPLVFSMRENEIAWDVAEQAATLRFPPDHMLALLSCGIRSSVALPIWTGSEPLAVLTLGFSTSPLHHADLDLIKQFARRVENALANARMFAREYRVSHMLQQALLPPVPARIGAMPVSAAYLPAGSEAEIGGDWYDVFPLPKGRFGISVGDVAGHGIDATATMNVARHSIRVAALSLTSPAAVLEHVDRMLHMEAPTPMITAIFGILHPGFRRFEYSIAGHPPPIIASSSGGVQTLACAGPPLGVAEDSRYVTQRAQLGLDDSLVLYSDGMIEFGHDLIAGERRLREAVRRTVDAHAPEPAVAIQDAIFGSQKPQDDAIVLVVRSSLPSCVNVDLEARPQSCRSARVLLRQFLGDHQIVGSCAQDIVTAAGEAVTNAIEHAYAHKAPGDVSFRLAVEDHRLRITVRDRGQWHETNRPNRGRGIPLMRAMMDEVEVEKSAAGTSVHLTKQL